MFDFSSLNLDIKKIDRKKYLYARDSIYINKGEILQKYKNLGRIMPGQEIDINYKLQDFITEIKKIAIEERTKYWNKKTKDKKVYKYISINNIETLRTELYRNRENLGFAGKNALKTAFMADFLYNSNRIEGSKLPRKTVEQKMQGNTNANNEVVNTMKAIDFLNNVKLPCALSKILEGQKILMGHEPSKQGIRKEPVIVGEAHTADFQLIRKKMRKLMEWYKKTEYTLYPPELAFNFYYKFERIHPFPDGNGRIGRILMNNILKKHKYHPIIIWNQNVEAHASAFLHAMNGKPEKYLKFMFEQMKTTYKRFINKIKPAASLDKQYMEILKPSRN